MEDRDPFARELSRHPDYPHSNCVVRDPAAYPWHDAGFRPPAFNDLIIYQLHVGAFARRGHKKQGRFLDVAERVPYLAGLGVNAVELLPVVEFPNDNSLGYNNVDFFSPEMGYAVGGAEVADYLPRVNALLAARGKGPLEAEHLSTQVGQLKALVDVSHAYGIALFFDVVYNHAGDFGGGPTESESLYFLDRYFPDDQNNSLYFTDHDWVGKVFAFYDVPRTAERPPVPHRQRRLLADRGARRRAAVRRGEGDRRQRRLEVPPGDDRDGAGGEAGGPADRRVLAGRPGVGGQAGGRRRGRVRPGLGRRSAGRGPRSDLAVGRRAGRGREPRPGAGPTLPAVRPGRGVAGGDPPGEPRPGVVRARRPPAADRSPRRPVERPVLVRPQPGAGGDRASADRAGVPMLFMGQEFLEDKLWSDNPENDTDTLWWDGLSQDRAMGDHLRFTRELIGLRLREPALRGGPINVFHVHNDDRVIAFHRWLEGAGRDVVVVASLNESTQYGYRIGFPGGGWWTEVFNSDVYDNWVNPIVAGNGGGVPADGPPWQGQPASAAVVIPANGLVIFTRD